MKGCGRDLEPLTVLLIAMHLGKLICKLPLDKENNKLFEEIMTDFYLDKKYLSFNSSF